MRHFAFFPRLPPLPGGVCRGRASYFVLSPRAVVVCDAVASWKAGNRRRQPCWSACPPSASTRTIPRVVTAGQKLVVAFLPVRWDQRCSSTGHWRPQRWCSCREPGMTVLRGELSGTGVTTRVRCPITRQSALLPRAWFGAVRGHNRAGRAWRGAKYPYCPT